MRSKLKIYWLKTRKLLLAEIILASSILLVITCARIHDESIPKGTNIYTSIDSVPKGSYSNLPDIYLIIPDEFPGKSSLETYFGYNNSGFTEALASRGFYIVNGSRSNYPCTNMVLSSVLNLDYLSMSPEGLLDPIDRKVYQNCSAKRFLKSKDYTTINIGSGWSIREVDTSIDQYSDINLVQPAPSVWARAIGQKYLDWNTIMPGQYNFLKEIPDLNMSTFTIMHTLGAHSPWIYSSEGAEPSSNNRRELILGQIQYVSKLLLDSIDTILAKSQTPPIILLVSDTGAFDSEELYSRENISARLSNFEAFYLPGLNQSSKELFCNPVNIFRSLFNSYFGENYSVLTGQYFYVPDWTNQIKLIEVSDLLGGQ
jgi:hypothetical protein